MEPEESLVVWIRTYQNTLYRVAYLVTGGHQADAEDLLQKALLEIAMRWQTFHSPEHAVNYARKTIINATKRVWMHRSRFVPHAEVPDHEAPDAGGPEQPLHGALRRLPTKYRAVLVARYFESCTVEETAKLLGYTEQTVKNVTRRALMRLNKSLRADYPERTRPATPPVTPPAFP